MNWLTPSYAYIAAGIAVPTLLILYFLKLRRRDVEISTTLLWKKAIQDLQANAPFQRLRRNILLLLQLLVLAGIIAALAQPLIKGQEVSGQRHVLLLDRSASMMAKDETDAKGGATTRFEAAKRQIEGLIDSMKEGGFFDNDQSHADQAMLIAFDNQAEIRQTFTSDKGALKRALESITVTEAPTRIEEAIRLAKAQQRKRVVEGQEVEGLTADEPFTMHIYSDGRIADASSARPSPEDVVEFNRFGTTDAANVAIVGLRAERSYENPAKLSVYVSLQNNEASTREVDVEFVIDGTVAGIKKSVIPAAAQGGVGLSAGAAAKAAAEEKAAREAAGATPGGPAPAAATLVPAVGGVVFSLERAAGGVVEVRLHSPASGEALDHDVLDIDNRAWLVVPPAKKLAVAVVSTQGNLFLTSALEGLPLSRLEHMTPSQFEARVTNQTTGEFDVIILDGWLPKGCAAAAATGPLAPATPAPVTPGAPATPGAAPATPGTPAAPAAARTEPPDTLPPGRYLILGSVPARLGGEDTGLRLIGAPEGASIVDWSRDHPVLRACSLDGLMVAKAPKIQIVPGGASSAIAMGDSGPLLADCNLSDVRAMVVPFDVAESNWPFNVSFVVFVAGSVSYLGEDVAAGGSGRQVQPGSILSDRVPSGAGDVRVKLPGGDSQKLQAASDGRVVFGPLTRSGVYELSWEGAGGPSDIISSGRAVRPFAANLLDSGESDVAATASIDLANKQVVASGQGKGVGDRKLWPWFMLAALGVVMLEWFVYNKKVHI